MSDTPESTSKKETDSAHAAASTEAPCPSCGATGQFNILAPSAVEQSQEKLSHMGLPASSLPEVLPTEGLTKWEQDTFRDIINNVNNTLRFQIQLAVPILAGCVTALNIVPPQEHQEFLNNFDRFVFIPVLLSMGAAYHGLEIHWAIDSKNKPSDSVESLSKLVKRKYLMVHTAITLQAIGLILLISFVLLEFK